ncbi:UNVERIFIED_CONTAM: hypothetical protein Sradi_0539400 [Sesamum radiatum]|uniref:Uncharacterized protein n=1 Tax=Sesamum radiatum TaxID=300843 RepID=A0AAW2VJF4_SESRA
MASQGARADPVASREESGESIEGSVAPASVGRVDVGREGVGADAPHPPGGAPIVGLPPEYAPEAVATQEDRCYRFEQGLRPEIKRGSCNQNFKF